MESFELGHRETQTALPTDPLQRTGFFSLSSLGLPATALSIVSIVVLGIVLVLLSANGETRLLFWLPWMPLWAWSAVAAALSWGILVGCRNRPGRHLPRIWTWVLTTLTSVLVLLSIIDVLEVRKNAQFHILVLAVLASGLSLLPRLVKVRPDKALIQWIASLSLVMVLIVILPLAWYVRQEAIRARNEAIDDRIADLDRWRRQVEDVTEYDWTRLVEAEEIGERVRALQSIMISGALNDPDLWKSAAILGKADRLDRAARDLLEALVKGLDAERTPKLSSLPEPAIWWDPAARTWRADSRFPELSEIVGLYHQQLGRLFLGLEVDSSGTTQEPLDLESYYQEKRDELQGQMKKAAASWPDHWPIFSMPEHEVLIGRGQMSLVEILRASMGGNGTPAPADFSRLLRTTFRDARRWVPIPGCHGRGPYTEEPREFYRLDCYNYEPAKSGGATLRLDMRIVYQSEKNRNLENGALPVELFYLFPIPKDDDNDDFWQAVMADLKTAAETYWPGTIRTRDRGGSAKNGFTLDGETITIQVLEPRVVDYYGDRQAFQVRVVKVSS